MNSPENALARLEGELMARLFSGPQRLLPGDLALVAFSGGGDSLALLLGLCRLRRRYGVSILAAHLDHALDADSSARAARARELAAALGVPLIAERLPEPPRFAGESLEAGARRERYEFLERQRARLGARCILTAHHRDDQAETVALRLLHGTGLEGLAGIRPQLGFVWRPLLGLARADLVAALAVAGHTAIDDPTNRDQRRPRNLLRLRLLPALNLATPGIAARLAALASAALGANGSLDRRLLEWIEPSPTGEPAIRLSRLAVLPEALQIRALTLLHRLAGSPLPPTAQARRELLRQLRQPRAPACDCGRGWRWKSNAGYLTVGRGGEPLTASFTYTLTMPGRVHIREIGLDLGLRLSPVEPWMFEGSAFRAALAFPAVGGALTVRNRRPGDRIQPLGGPGSRRLKDLLIDHRVPRAERDRKPLLVVGERIAWVPGVTIDERFRLGDQRQAWVAEITPP